MLEKLIDEFERIDHIDICFLETGRKNKIIDQIVKEIGAFRVSKGIGYILFHSHGRNLLRVSPFAELDDDEGRYGLWFEHPLTKSKWYWSI